VHQRRLDPAHDDWRVITRLPISIANRQFPSPIDHLDCPSPISIAHCRWVCHSPIADYPIAAAFAKLRRASPEPKGGGGIN